jgi:hypothetical protein
MSKAGLLVIEKIGKVQILFFCLLQYWSVNKEYSRLEQSTCKQFVSDVLFEPQTFVRENLLYAYTHVQLTNKTCRRKLCSSNNRIQTKCSEEQDMNHMMPAWITRVKQLERHPRTQGLRTPRSIPRDAGTGRGSRPRCPLPGGARGAKVLFQFKGLPWRNSELSLNVSAILLQICFRKCKKCSHRASRIAVIAQSPGGEPPHTPIIQ